MSGQPPILLWRTTRACFQMSQPESNGGDGEHRQVVDGPFLIVGRYAPELLEAVDQPFDDIALPIGGLIEPDSPLSLLPSNDHANAAAPQISPDLLAAVTLVTGHSVGSNSGPSTVSLHRSRLHQRLEHHLLVTVAGREQQ